MTSREKMLSRTFSSKERLQIEWKNTPNFSQIIGGLKVGDAVYILNGYWKAPAQEILATSKNHLYQRDVVSFYGAKKVSFIVIFC